MWGDNITLYIYAYRLGSWWCGRVCRWDECVDQDDCLDHTTIEIISCISCGKLQVEPTWSFPHHTELQTDGLTKLQVNFEWINLWRSCKSISNGSTFDEAASQFFEWLNLKSISNGSTSKSVGIRRACQSWCSLPYQGHVILDAGLELWIGMPTWSYRTPRCRLGGTGLQDDRLWDSVGFYAVH